MDFHVFVRQRRDALRAAFAWATFFGLDPDDITQDTLIRAHRRYRGFPSDDELFKWCVTVGHNMIRKQRRRALRRWSQLHPDPLALVTDAEPVDAEARAVAKADLDRFLATLRPRYAQVLRLDAKGLTREEMAAELGISGPAVGMLLHRARKAAQDGWGKIVAACAAVVARVRHTAESAATGGPAQTAMIATVSLSMVAALVIPGAGRDAEATHGLEPFVTPRSRLAADVHGPTVPPDTVRAAQPAAIAADEPQPAGPGGKTPESRPPVPKVPEQCAPGAVCVGSCPEPDETPGDRIYLKPFGPCQIRVAEAITPICEDVPENPAVGCERREPDHWLVEDPTIPEGDSA